ncbi:MAG: hypothetical protein CL920_34340 [Deltaproteobacteria bacterium]|nr:hypothetical protein [Deltaproteobacteria bacterium]MBU53804.1 hypothetical protein [Deltaproteobacteria bacterium]|tara:strand:- start:10696 stop:11907 length:1212 start_codon:yes stop_codon:yes gene_type:complete
MYKERLRNWIHTLEQFGHRGSGTEQEAKAARYLVEELESMGIPAQTEPFTGSSNMGARLVTHVIFSAAGLVFISTYPLLMATFALIGLISLILESTTKFVLLSKPFVRRPSQNVVGVIPAKTKASRRILLVAHYDTQRTGLLWVQAANSSMGSKLDALPGVMKSPMFVVLCSMSIQIVLGLLMPLGLAPSWAMWLFVPAGVFYSLGFFLLGEWALRDFVPGANDNASGTAAVLGLAHRWKEERPANTDDIELVLLLTGCEEPGLIGASAYAEQHKPSIQSTPTNFINIDSIGYGHPQIIGGEYTLAGQSVRYQAPLLALASEVAKTCDGPIAEPIIIPVQSDGMAFELRGIHGLSFISRPDDHSMPNYHLPSDLLKNLDMDAVTEGFEFSWSVLHRLSTQPPS